MTFSLRCIVSLFYCVFVLSSGHTQYISHFYGTIQPVVLKVLLNTNQSTMQKLKAWWYLPRGACPGHWISRYGTKCGADMLRPLDLVPFTDFTYKWQ